MPAQTFHTDADYQSWLADHPNGFVVNTTRGSSPNYMVLHSASCRYISNPTHESEAGGFTERGYTKVAADDIQSLREWVMTHGRQNGSFSSECSSCRPSE